MVLLAERGTDQPQLSPAVVVHAPTPQRSNSAVITNANLSLLPGVHTLDASPVGPDRLAAEAGSKIRGISDRYDSSGGDRRGADRAWSIAEWLDVPAEAFDVELSD